MKKIILLSTILIISVVLLISAYTTYTKTDKNLNISSNENNAQQEKEDKK